MTKGKKRGKGGMYLHEQPKNVFSSFPGQIGMIQIMKQNLPSDMNDHIME